MGLKGKEVKESPRHERQLHDTTRACGALSETSLLPTRNTMSEIEEQRAAEPQEQEAASEKEVINTFQNLRQEVQQLFTKINELESEKSEHTLVIGASPLPSTRARTAHRLSLGTTFTFLSVCLRSIGHCAPHCETPRVPPLPSPAPTARWLFSFFLGGGGGGAAPTVGDCFPKKVHEVIRCLQMTAPSTLPPLPTSSPEQTPSRTWTPSASASG